MSFACVIKYKIMHCKHTSFFKTVNFQWDKRGWQAKLLSAKSIRCATIIATEEKSAFETG